MKKILLLLSVILIAKLMNAQTWDGSASTDWNTAANWSTNTVPINTSSITIPGGVPNNPALPSNITLAGLTMNTAGVLNFNGFALTTGNLNLNNATLNNSSGVTDIVINCSGSTLQYASTTVNDNLTVNVSGTGIFYEGFPSANIHNGNTNFVLNGAGQFQSSYSAASTFNGDLTVTRTVAGTTTLFVNGHNGITGNFTYNNNAGGPTSINSSGVSPTLTAPVITGTINITVANGGAFTMRRIINNTGGGTINVATTYAIVTNDTLLVTAANFSGMATGNVDDFDRLQITGNFSISDLAGNSNDTYLRRSIMTGTTTVTANGTATFYEAYQVANIFNGNTSFVLNGTSDFQSSYNAASTFNGNLTVTRTVAGPTNLFVNGHNGITGNFSYSNNAGGLSSINSAGASPAAVAPSITGTVNITVANGGPFTMRRIINNTAGGSINVVTTYALVTNDTLLVTAANFSGMATGNVDDFDRLQITGNFSISDLAGNSNDTYLRRSIITGTTTVTSNGTATFYEAYQGANIFNGNTSFVLNGTADFQSSYNAASTFNGNLTVTRTIAGPTNLL